MKIGNSNYIVHPRPVRAIPNKLNKSDFVRAPNGATGKVMVADNVAGKYLVRLKGDTVNTIFLRRDLVKICLKP
jgi:hypothetical protein